ncbi:MAG: CDP-diacylglycerol--glycerol-3-phosphate 3-phosphatidyltransferase [Ruminococcaceae bacterium]|nr:CDP-diacylglycerol--glycerol-3-phosphate 3-phosphatidyltransferase [Oscillospiraceae bacterium]
MKMNLPNKLTVLRLILVPVIMIVGMLPYIPFLISCFLVAFLFILTAVTDMLDGKIARKRGLITDFGKFLDPVADKFMVIGTLFVILFKPEFNHIKSLIIFSLVFIVFRELAVTSMRLVVSTGEGIVIAANSLGKIKTVSQIVAIATTLLEPVVQHVFARATGLTWDGNILPLTYLTLIFSIVMTVWSGISYIKSYWKYLDPEK